MDEFKELLEDLKTARSQKFNISCCKSYTTPKGRCYTCPDNFKEDMKKEFEEYND